MLADRQPGPIVINISTPPPRRPQPDPAEDRAARDRKLLARYRDPSDPVDRDAVVERFLPLARRLAQRYARPDAPLDDLFQVASLALVKAVDRFDPARETAFASYAVPVIVGEIKRHFRDRTWSVRPPRDVQELALKIQPVVDELGAELRRVPTITEIASHIGCDEEQVLEARIAFDAYSATSLDVPASGDDQADTIGGVIGDDERGYIVAEARATLQRMLRVLSARERTVLHLRFHEDLTQVEISRRIGISQMQVSRIIRDALARLHAQADDVPR